MIKVSAPGKIHLSGEHSVVYGQPALLSAIDKRLFITLHKRKDKKTKFNDESSLVKFGINKIYKYLNKKPKYEFNLEIDSQIPIGSGLGSSAALAVAMTGAILKFEDIKWDKKLINKIAYEIEKKQHGNPSGGDNTIACYGGLLIFQKRNDEFKFNQLQPTGCKYPEFTLINSGKPVENTREMVLAVKTKYQRSRIKYEQLFEKMGRISSQIIDCFINCKFNKTNHLIRENERLLEDLGVVGNKAKTIIRGIEKIGGSAKICGAGGIKKGSGMILAYHLNPLVFKNFLAKQKLRFMKVNLNQEGIRLGD